MKNLHKKILVTVFAALVIALPLITFFALPDEPMPFSENENRYLLPFIEPDLRGYFAGFFSSEPNNISSRQFMERFDEWFADRFAFREPLIVLQNELEMLRGITEIGGVFTADGRHLLAWRECREAMSGLPDTLAAVDEFAAQMQELHGAQTYIMLVPTASEIYRDSLPPNAQVGDQTAVIARIYAALLENAVSIDVLTPLSENAAHYIFYRTDHHQTAFGSYLGYFAAGSRMGFTPLDLGRFDVEHAANDFRGTLFSRTLNRRITPDVISFYTLSGGSREVTLTINTGFDVIERDTFFFREYLDAKDKYMAFMGGNQPIVEIVTDADNDASLLVFKDSFAHSMLPFFANHYRRITVADMRLINTDISEFVNLGEYDQVLFIYSATMFAEDTALQRLNMIDWG
jgi:hypothetical protein